MTCATGLWEKGPDNCVADCGDGWESNAVTMRCDSICPAGSVWNSYVVE
jgi:hypothetical protein